MVDEKDIAYFVRKTVWLTTTFMGSINTDMKNVRVVFTYARMNPPTEGHRRVVESLREEAQRTGAVARLYLSETHDTKRNPLDKETKLDFVRRAFPDIEVRTARTVFAAGCDIAADGGADAVMVVGEDRLESFTKTLTAYVDTDDLPLKTLEVRAISRGEDDTSATRAREAAASGDWTAFSAMSPTPDEMITRELFHAVRTGMGVQENGTI